jgi:arylamine N-acetyltransferase
MSPPHSHNLFDRFLAILGLRRNPPSIEALTELTAAFLVRFPFENISKLYYRNVMGLRTLPELEQYLDGAEQYHFGGTCYPNNYYLHLLLDHLGYRASLCGADMNRPDVHLVNVVRVDDRDFLVDAGYAAPFLKPMPLDLSQEWTCSLGRDRFVLSPRDDAGRSRLQMFRDGLPRHGYYLNPKPRRIEEFSGVIAHSFSDEATFMNALLMVRFSDNRSLAINNLEVIESIGLTLTISKIADKAALPSTIEQLFGIPAEIGVIAVNSLGELGDAWN